jgi:hypothetical protein
VRIPLVTEIDSRDGSSNRDERLTNMLAEKDSELMACVRPGLNTLLASSGDGNGLVCFNSQIVHVFGTALKFGTTPTSISTVVDGEYDFAVIP